MTVNVDGEKYEGSGASKKMAKHACARGALTKLYNMSFTPHMPGKLLLINSSFRKNIFDGKYPCIDNCTTVVIFQEDQEVKAQKIVYPKTILYQVCL